MYFSNGMVYGNSTEGEPEIVEVRALPDQILILTFKTGEQRIFDATVLNGAAFEPLKNPDIFQDVKLDYGVVTWLDGEIDCAPEYMYEHSYEYSKVS